MELFKNIFFNTDKLTPYITVKITYAGNLFEKKSQEIILHYCFNKNWTNAKDIKMIKSELGYQAEIKLNNDKELNICFFNENNEWDNNNSNNYNFSIEQTQANTNSIENNNLLPSKKIASFYLWKKRLKLGFIKIIKFITGNYKRKIKEKNG